MLVCHVPCIHVLQTSSHAAVRGPETGRVSSAQTARPGWNPPVLSLYLCNMTLVPAAGAQLPQPLAHHHSPTPYPAQSLNPYSRLRARPTGWGPYMSERVSVSATTPAHARGRPRGVYLPSTPVTAAPAPEQPPIKGNRQRLHELSSCPCRCLGM